MSTASSTAAIREYGNGVIALANGFRAYGLPVPTVSEVIEEHTAAFPDRTLDQEELRFLAKYAGGDVSELVEAIPADKVPAEISGVWYEIRASLPLVQQIGDFLADPDDEPEGEDDALASLLAALAG